MGRMRCAVLALSLVGCNQIYGLDPTQLDDLEPPACSTVRFGPPRAIPQFVDGAAELDPQLSADGNELWFTRAEVAGFTILRGTRESADAPYTVTPAGLLATATSTLDAALTADGRRLMFLADDTGGRRLYEAVRATPTTFPFDRLLMVSGLGQFQLIQSIDLSWDGLRLYFGANEGQIYVAERATRDAPFGDATMLFDAAWFPTVSGDELEIFYNRFMGTTREMFRRARADRSDAFGPEELVLDDGSDPDISPTSSVLVVVLGNGLSILDRPCPK